LDVEHLLVNFLGGHAATEHGGGSEVTSVTWIGGAHHVLGIPHLLGKLWDGQGTVLLRATGSQWRETNHEEVETWEWDQVDSQLTQVSVQLTWETEAARHTGHGGRDQVVKITEGWRRQLERAEADVVQGLVIEHHALVGVLNKLMHGEGGVVWLDDSVGHLWRWENGERKHHAVWVLFTDLGDQECAHTGTGATTHGVAHLETLETIARLGFLADNVKDGVDELRTLSVVTLRPVVTGTSLSEDKVVWAEDLTVWARADGVHGTWLQIHEDGAWHVTSASGFVEVHVDALQLEVRVTMVGTCWVDTVLVADDFPELGTDLVTALAALDMNDLTHG
jgi:hypothetical protein